MAQILITGGAGFIGTHLVRRLSKTQLPVRIIDCLTPQIHGQIPQDLNWLEKQNVEVIRGSITDRRTLEMALDGVTHIIHLAAETGTGQSMYEMARYNEVNSQGTALMLDVIGGSKKSTVQRIVLASSRSIYGEGAYVCNSCCTGERLYPPVRHASQLAQKLWEPICWTCGGCLNAVPTREDDKACPASIYAATKFAQEDLIRVACTAWGIGYAVLRLQNVYGEGQSLKNPYTGILSIFSTRVRRELDLPIFEDGLESRDFVHVDDVVKVMESCLLSEQPISQVVNVGSGIGTSVMDVAKQLVTSLGGTSALRVTGEYRLGDIRHNVADISRLRQIVPGVPSVGLAEGLDRFAGWVLTQPLPDDRLDQANAELRARKLMA